MKSSIQTAIYYQFKRFVVQFLISAKLQFAMGMQSKVIKYNFFTFNLKLIKLRFNK